MAANPNLSSNSKAVLRFLPNWQQQDEGEISRGDTVAIEFAPERLPACRQNWRGAEVWEIEAFAKFHPRGELLHASLLDRVRTAGVVTMLVPKPMELAVPIDAKQLELWFHNFTEFGGRCDTWDSRFGENYWFDIGGPQAVVPQDQVRYREGAIPRLDLVNVVDQFAIKRNVFPSRPNGSPDGKDLRTSLTLRVWVKNVAYAKDVWADLHVFDRSGTRIVATTFGLPWEESASGAGDLFRFDGEIYHGTTATPGAVSPKPDAWLVQYRLYYAVEGQTYTDGIVHQLELPDDAVT